MEAGVPGCALAFPYLLFSLPLTEILDLQDPMANLAPAPFLLSAEAGQTSNLAPSLQDRSRP
jgi:hypothetical protein